jgi:hypothetical protein
MFRQEPEAVLTPALGLKANIAQIEQQHYFSCNGNIAPVSENTASWLCKLSKQSGLTNRELFETLIQDTGIVSEFDSQLLTELLNAGLWYWE